MFKGDTSYIKLGFATPANIERNHLKAMYEFQQNNYNQLPDCRYLFVNDILQYSNGWKGEFNKILWSNKFLETEEINL